jgi:hypothetical protein
VLTRTGIFNELTLNNVTRTPINHNTNISENSSTTGKQGSGTAKTRLAVWSVIPNPTKCLIDTTEINDYDEVLIRYVEGEE